MHSVTASYSGDSSYQTSRTPAGSPTTFTITQAATRTSITPSQTSVPLNSTFIVTAKVSTNIGLNPLTGYWGGTAVPSGTVTLFSGGKQIAVDTAIGGPIIDPVTQTGQAVGAITIAASALPIGQDSITAVYAGDFRYTGSTSSAITVDVGYPTNTALTSSNPTVPVATNVTFTAQVTTSQSGGPAITGNVVFQIDGSGGSTVPLVNGTAQFTTSFASSVPTFHQIKALYSGDTNYIPSVGSLQEGIVIPDFTLSDSLGNVAQVVIAAPGQSSAPVTLTVNGMNGYNGTIVFSPASCVITPAGSLSSCSFTPSSITGSGSTQLVISTTAPRAAGTPYGSFGLDGRKLQPIAICLLFLVTLAIFKKQRRFSLVFGSVLLMALFGLGACGGGSSGASSSSAMTSTNTIPGTPTGVPYAVSIDAAPSGANSHTINLTFIVQ